MKYTLLIAVSAVAALTLSACQANENSNTPITATKSVPEQSETIKNIVPVKAIVNPNTASEADLRALPGMPENIPALILDARPFENAKAFDEFLTQHANDPTKQAIYKEVFIPMALNTTPEADFMIIPGVGKKMAHEFEEYRPYTDWEQFNREIGKYVDQDEVSRYRRYLTLD